MYKIKEQSLIPQDFDQRQLEKAMNCMESGFYHTAEFHFKNILYHHRRQREIRQ